MTLKHYTELQPKDGDTVLHCDHVMMDRISAHFFALGLPDTEGKRHGERVTRPDGSISVAQWIAICDNCYQTHKSNPVAAVSGDSRWSGDEPIIKAVSQ